MNELANQVAWVTGGGTGIGAAAAEALAADGAAVVLSGRRRDVLDEVAARIAGHGGAADVKPVDVADGAAMAAAADGIRDAHGRIDILVHSAGTNIPNRSWSKIEPEGWKLIVDVNLNGSYNAVQAVLPAMREAGGGLLILISSWAGRYDTLLTGPGYNATKHGMRAMAAHLNLEEGKNGIRCCTVMPGEVNTPILDKRPIPVPEEERVRMMQPEDMGETVRYVARLHPR
ncbi:MAG: SDR family NAD(P)-dependent oxidoreductase, partial [Rhodospirillaceae bacterium]|nr:SDR family NAD(P)-dependent oxidoreductase [Rhodospirillaceae bacterium]